LRFLLISGVVLLHIPSDPLVDKADTNIFPFITAFVSHALFKTTVPMLTCISGFLLFHSSLDQNFPKLLAKKTKSLLLPFLLSNVPLAAFVYYGQANGLFADFRAHLYPPEATTVLDAVLSMTTSPVNHPLYFLRDLFILSLLSPLLGLMIRKTPWIGLLALCVVVILDLDGPIILRDTMIVNFYMGGMAAVLLWDLTKLDRFAPICAALLLGACVAIVGFWVEDIRAFAIVAPFLIWPISSMLVGTSVGNLCEWLSPHSFFVFLTHAPIIMVLWDYYLKSHVVSYEVFWLTAPVLIIATCVAAHKIVRSV